MDAIVSLSWFPHVETVQYGTCKIWNVNQQDAFRVIARLDASRVFTRFSCAWNYSQRIIT